jgi:putative polyhydroxyalkanoate system protein
LGRRGRGFARDEAPVTIPTSLYFRPEEERFMATIAIAKTHKLSHTHAKQAAQKIADDLHERFDLECTWNGDRIDFRRPGVSGTLHVGRSDVRLEAELGFLLSMLKAKIEEVVHRDFDKYFGKAGR